MSTLTPVLNEEAYIRATVAALQAQDVAGEAEFLFMDGRSTDRTKEILRELAAEDPRIRVLDNPARHTASGLNIGLRAARCETSLSQRFDRPVASGVASASATSADQPPAGTGTCGPETQSTPPSRRRSMPRER